MFSELLYSLASNETCFETCVRSVVVKLIPDWLLPSCYHTVLLSRDDRVLSLVSSVSQCEEV